MVKIPLYKATVLHTQYQSSSTPKLFLCLMVMGFISGLPFILTLSTLSLWLAELGFTTKAIGLFTIVSLPYALKFLWSPFIDKFELPFLKSLHPIKRFGFLAIVFLFLSLVLLSQINPQTNIILLAITATFVSFFAATHDMTLDTLRIYASDSKNLGGGAASEAIGFRLGMLTSGAGAVYLSVVIGWQGAYLAMAFCCLLGLISLWYLPNPSPQNNHNKKNIFSAPLKSLTHTPNLLNLIFFLFTVKISGSIMNALSAPFLLELGFSKIEYASISKIYGTSLMLIGSFLGGLLIHKRSAIYCLNLSIIFQMLACILFCIMSYINLPHVEFLIFTLSIESLSNGLLATGLITYISIFCKAPYIASHFTLLYSIGSMARVASSIAGGYVADHFGWTFLFAVVTFTSLPALIFLKNTSKGSQIHD